MTEPKVCIVTPIHNGISETVRFLDSLARLIYPNVEAIVVDDGSTDGSSETIRDRFPRTMLLRGDGGLWWTGATNLGVKEALARGADFVYTVNNDVVMAQDAITASVSCALSHSPALVGSTVYFLENRTRIWFAGARLDAKTGDIEHDRHPILDPRGIRETEILTGMGMLVPSEVFSRIGFFDQTAFPHYLADCDFSLRAARAGFRLLVTRESQIYNEVGSAWSVRQMKQANLRFLGEMIVSKRSAYWFVGRVRFYKRHWGRGKIRALARLYVTWFWTYVAPTVVRRVLRLRIDRT